MKMRPAFFVLIVIFSGHLFAQDKKQPNIKFDTDYFQALDHWVVLPESDYLLLGYIYIDRKEGFTFALQAAVTIDDQKWTLVPQTHIVTKHLNKNTPLVSMLSEKKILEFRLRKPHWLKIEASGAYEELYWKGFHYNAIGQNRLAVLFLENAFRLSSRAAFELSFAYNATGQYEKAIALLQDVLKTDSKSHMLYRELGFSLIQCERIEEAEAVYEKGFAFCENDTQKRAMAIDMAQTFYRLKRHDKFIKWSAVLKKHTAQDNKTAQNNDPAEGGNED